MKFCSHCGKEIMNKLTKVGGVLVALVVLSACAVSETKLDLDYGETYSIEDEKLTSAEDLIWEIEDPHNFAY